MPIPTEGCSSSTAAGAGDDQIKQRKPRDHLYHHHHQHRQHQQEEVPSFSPETDPNPHASRSSNPKSAISSLFLLPFSTNSTANAADSGSAGGSKKKGAAFRGLGCTAGAAQQVSVPAVIRSSADWEGKRVKKKKSPQKQKRKKDGVVIKIGGNENGKAIHQIVGESSGGSSSGGGGAEGSGNGGGSNGGSGFSPGSCMVMQDVWCGPGMGLSADAVVGSVDCVVSRRNVAGRGKIDGEKVNPRERERERERERPSCLARRAAVNPESFSFWDADPVFLTSHPEPEVFGARYYRHVRHPSPDALAEIMMLQSSFMMGGRSDRFSSWRLDIDHMSYEQLLELSDRIGYVNTGLKEDEIARCVRKIKIPIRNELSSHLPVIVDKKCTVCQEDYEADDELGKLDCGHGYHLQCIKQWLAHKNSCPVCKTAPVARG